MHIVQWLQYSGDGHGFKPKLPLSQLHVSLLAGVLLGSARQLLGDDQLANIDAVAQKIRDDLFGVIHGALWVPGESDWEMTDTADYYSTY